MGGVADGHATANSSTTAGTETSLFVRTGLVGNAVFAALSTVSLPLLLSQEGATKSFIAIFFVCSALGGATLSITVGRLLLRCRSPRIGVLAASLTAAAGMFATTALHPGWLLWITGPAVMANSLGYPQLVTAAPSDSGRQVAAIRTLFVLGYVLGLGIFAASTALSGPDGTILASRLAIAVAACNAAAALFPVRDRRPGSKRQAGSAGPSLPLRASMVLACLAVLFLRSADSLRQVYLPLYAVTGGLPSAMVSALFTTTAAAEMVVLGPLGRLNDRVGSHQALMWVAGAGVASALTISLANGPVPLIASQLLYGVFAAGFQSIGMVLLGELLPSGVGGGAVTYMALVQLGSTLGIVAPLLVPGYTPGVFVIAALFCAAAVVLLVPGLYAWRSGVRPPG